MHALRRRIDSREDKAGSAGKIKESMEEKQKSGGSPEQKHLIWTALVILFLHKGIES